MGPLDAVQLALLWRLRVDSRGPARRSGKSSLAPRLRMATARPLLADIYAGFNHLLRGGTIPYIEYMQVGKGRDVGMQQIYKLITQFLNSIPSYIAVI